MMDYCNVLIFWKPLNMQNTSGCGNKTNAAKATIQVFGTLFLIEMTNQDNRAVIHSSPGC